MFLGEGARTAVPPAACRLSYVEEGRGAAGMYLCDLTCVRADLRY